MSAGSNGFQQAFNKVARYRGAVELGWYDFITVFRRSFFGALWPAFQLAAWVGTLTLLFSGRLGGSIGEYALYVGIGAYAWDFISWSLGEGPGHITSQGQLLKNVPSNLSTITVRKIAYLVFRSAFQLPVPLFVLFMYADPVGPEVLLLAPVIPLYLLSAFSMLTIMGIIGVYFRDFQFLMPSITRILFFTTPIFWRGDSGFRKILSDYNPFSYYLELVRAPLTGEFASLQAWGVVGFLSVSGFFLAIFLQSKFRHEVVYRI